MNFKHFSFRRKSSCKRFFAEILPDIFIKCKKNNIKFKIYQQCLDDQKLEFTKKI